ncbi:MAG TPA: ATP synthase F1 subunit epsilon [Actinomycetota bacterium]|nr:ATP synthase F1 subunit epsilon [Actinomycetota bacterium]
MALEVDLVTPEREVWSDRAQMVIARGTDGMVGILAGHAPLLIRLAIGTLRIQDEAGDWLEAVVDGGFLHVTSHDEDTRVDVLATGAELDAEIDRQAAEARVADLQARLAEGDDAAVRTELAKALARAGVGE